MDVVRTGRRHAGYVPLVLLLAAAALGAEIAHALGWPIATLMLPGLAAGYAASRALINRWFAPRSATQAAPASGRQTGGDGAG